MKLISWNVNGLRAVMNKGYMDFFREIDADFFCVQETKMQQGQLELELPGYEQYWNSAVKKGYSGTAIFTKHQPQSVVYGLGLDEHDQEGRVITLEYESFFLTNVYTPNSQRGLARLDYRMNWDDDFRSFVGDLSSQKPVIVCGDLNVAHREVDLKNPSTNRKNAGFSDEERGKFSELLESGFIDTYRHFYPDKTDAYTWWSYFSNARERNIGWRIDYFLVSEDLEEKLVEARIHDQVFGSDHCPVELEIKP
ncbi:MAG TPA: exodeoxyribonuclease III [Firmicutes bacterium]|nr:exodeoxyribonuclease III [Bacillota bacterium]